MAGLLANNGKPLGKLRGVFFTNGENRNDYPCNDVSANNAEKEDLMQEKLITGGVIGRVDHTNHNPDTNPNDETLVKESAVNMRKFPRRNNRGEYIGECLILDTPDGQKIYAYCKSGKKPGVSYRGGIDQEAYERGDAEAAWKQFTVEGFDIVLVPAYRECYLELVEDYLDPDSECYVEFKKEYLDKDAPIRKTFAGRKAAAGIDAVGAARAMLKVAASKQGAKEMAQVMAQEKHFTEAEAVAINKAIDEANIDGNRRTKEQAEAIGTPYDVAPKHTWVRQEGNGTLDMHDETGIYGKDDVDPITGKKIETLNTGNKSERDIPIVGKQTDEQKKHAEASLATKANINPGDKAQKIAEEVADELITEEINKKKAKAGIEKGTVADKGKNEDEQLEGYVDKDGKVVKKTTAGVLGVAGEEETPEEKEKKGDLGKDGKVTEQVQEYTPKQIFDVAAYIVTEHYTDEQIADTLDINIGEIPYEKLENAILFVNFIYRKIFGAYRKKVGDAKATEYMVVHAIAEDLDVSSVADASDISPKLDGSEKIYDIYMQMEIDAEKYRDDYLAKPVQSIKSAITRTEASSLGVKAEDKDPEVEILTDDGIKELGSEIVNDESGDENKGNGDETAMQKLVAEIAKLTEEIFNLKAIVTGKDNELNNRNSELDDLTASYKRLKSTIANAVDKAKTAETVLAQNKDLQDRNANLAKVIARMKSDHKAVLAELSAETDDYKKVIAGYESETTARNHAMVVQANALRRQATDNKVLAGKNDNLGKLCIGMVAEMLGIDEGKLLAQRGEIRNKAQLEKVIANLQIPKCSVSASYYPVTDGMRNALPDDIRAACEKTDWDEDEEIS